MRQAYTITVFLGSALLFLVEPLIAKRLLPTFGGSPLVWNTCLLFFQIALLIGYLYAHLSTQKFGVRNQAKVHLGLMVLAALTLPIGLPKLVMDAYTHAAPGSLAASPALMLLLMLAAGVGLPFFVVSSSAPILQRWFADTTDPKASNPYFLYRASNIASMVALIGYPVLFESTFNLSDQSMYWSVGYGVLILGFALCAQILWKSPAPAHEQEGGDQHDTSSPPTKQDKARWTFQAAAPSALLLGVTGFLTVNIAPVPLLWVLPLALYLLTFVIAFRDKPVARPVSVRTACYLFISFGIISYAYGSNQLSVVLIPGHLLGFFFAAYICHAEIARTRPSAKYLTEFYFWISLGGMLGGLFSAIVAPIIFPILLEYPVAIALCIIAAAIGTGTKKPTLNQVLQCMVLVGAVTCLKAKWGMQITDPNYSTFIVAAFGVLLLCSLSVQRYVLASAATIMMLMYFDVMPSNQTILRKRNFFGSHLVRVFKGSDGADYHFLTNGNILHGVENQDPKHILDPLTYYIPESGVGLALTKYGTEARMKNYAVIGLGTGTLAGYGHAEQTIDYYELNPSIAKTAGDPKYFSFISKTPAKVNVILGDARLRMNEAADSTYGLIAVDAFSSDAIPTHLLTLQACEMYLRKLRPDGILAIHVSNRYLDLYSVVATVANQLNLVGADVKYQATDDDQARYRSTSEWVILAHDAKDLKGLQSEPASRLAPDRNVRIWTDDYTNIFQILRFKRT